MLSDNELEAIKASVTAQPIKIGPDEFVTRTVLAPPPEPRASPLQVSTLTGIVDFVKGNLDDDDGSQETAGGNGIGVAVHIESPRSVVFVSSIYGRARQREEYCRAKLEVKKFPFGEFMDNETFIIALRSQFIQNDQTEKI